VLASLLGCGDVASDHPVVRAGCAWPVRADRATLNIAYPDDGATYWATGYALRADERLVLRGEFPDARYASFITYGATGGAIDGLADFEIEPEAGSANPFRAPTAGAPGSPGHYRVDLRADVAPGAVANTLAVRGDDPATATEEARGTVIFRVYVPNDPTSPTGGRALPSIEVLHGDGTTSTVPACAHPGADEDSIRVVEENGPATDIPAPAVPIFVRPANGANLYPNPDNVYVATITSHHPGRVIVLRGRAPTFPDTRAGDPPWKPAQLRYWSLCSNEYRKPYPVSACVADFETAIDADGWYTFVVSTPEDRPPNANAASGITWLDWGDTTVDGLLLMRQMLAAPGFGGAAIGLPPGAPVVPGMGEWAPRGVYCERAVFESGGATACGL